MREFGSFAVSGFASFFIPVILEQNDFRLAASFSVLGFGAGGFSPGLPGLALL